MVRTCFTIVAVILTAASGWAIDPDINGVFRITTPAGAQGTGFVVAQDGDRTYLATAWHVVESSPKRSYTGNAYGVENDSIKDVPKAVVVSTDIDADLAVVRTTTSRRFQILPLAAVEDMPKVRKVGFAYGPSPFEVDVYGFGSGFWLKTSGMLSFAYDRRVYCDAVAASGQSGGPAVVNGNVIGVLSGGHSWYKAVEDTDRNITWPVRLGSAKRLKEILEWGMKQ